MASNPIPDFDEKVQLIIGNMLAKADKVSKTVLSAFDSSEDREANAKVLGGSRFTSQALDICAQFLDIDLVDKDNDRIFTNKPSLATRIILEIQSYFPAICAGCDAEYSVEFDSETKPALRCFLCFQGSHHCTAFAPSGSSPSSPIGTVWLCRSCHNTNNPAKRKKPKSKNASKANSKAPSGANTPVSTSAKVSFSAETLSEKLSTVSQLQQKIEEQLPQSTEKESGSVTNTITGICEKFKIGKCPHGISGKTEQNGRVCDKTHPKWCYRFARNGSKGKYGCRKGDKCIFYHPNHCPSSVSDKTCFSDKCTLVHLIGTKRHKRSDEESYRRTDVDYKRSQSNNSRRSVSTRQMKTPLKSRDEPQTEALQDIGNFLELRSLLTSLQETFQKEIKSLRSEIATQENKLTSIVPSLSQHHVIKQFLPQHPPGHMPPTYHQYLPHPHHHQPHPIQQTTNWHQLPVSGC